jgi:hypothetical protein
MYQTHSVIIHRHSFKPGITITLAGEIDILKLSAVDVSASPFVFFCRINTSTHSD